MFFSKGKFLFLGFTCIFFLSGCSLRGAPDGEVRGDQAGDRYWIKSYGTEVANETVLAMKPVSDGYLLAGSAIDPIKRSLGKTNGDGSMRFELLTETKSGKLAEDGWVQKIDLAGEVVWSKIHGEKDFCLEEIRGITRTANSDYISVGTIRLKDDSTDIGIMKTDADGHVIWCRAYNGTRLDAATYSTPINDIGYAIDRDSDGGYAIVGATNAEVNSEGSNFPDTDVLVIKINEDGDVVWQREFGNHHKDSRWEEMPYSIHAMRDNGWVIAATARADHGFRNPDEHFLVIRLTSDGSFDWSFPGNAVPAEHGFAYAPDEGLTGLDHMSAFEAIELTSGRIAVIGDRAYKEPCQALGTATCFIYKTMLFTMNSAGGDVQEIRFDSPDGHDLYRRLAIAETPLGNIIFMVTHPGNTAVVRSLRPDLSLAWEKQLPNTIGKELTVTADGNIFVMSDDVRAPVIRQLHSQTGEVLDTYTAPESDQFAAHTFYQLPQGGWLMAGTEVTHAKSGRLMKMNGDGTVAWNKMKGSSKEIVSDITESANGRLMAVGTQTTMLARSVSYSTRQAWVLQLDQYGDACEKNGNPACWQKLYRYTDPASSDRGMSDGVAILSSPDSATIVTRLPQSTQLKKINHQGEPLWDKQYAMTVTAAISTEDGGYLLAGLKNFSMILLKTDANGAPAWQKTFTNYLTNHVTAVAEITPGTYALTGDVSTYDDDSETFVLVAREENNSAMLVWQKILSNPGNDTGAGIAAGPDGSILLAGTTEAASFSGNASGNNLWAVKLSSAGDMVWQKLYATGGEDNGVAIANNTTNVIVAGNTTGISGSRDAWILSLNPDGSIGGACSNGLEESTNTRLGSMTISTVDSAQSSEEPIRSYLEKSALPQVALTPTITRQCSGQATAISPPSDYEVPDDASPEGHVPPRANPNINSAARASFTMTWDRATGVLELDASESTDGYNYVWDFGWTQNVRDSVPSQSPLMTTTIQADFIDLMRSISANWVVLYLMTDNSRIAAQQRQILQ